MFVSNSWYTRDFYLFFFYCEGVCACVREREEEASAAHDADLNAHVLSSRRHTASARGLFISGVRCCSGRRAYSERYGRDSGVAAARREGENTGRKNRRVEGKKKRRQKRKAGGREDGGSKGKGSRCVRPQRSAARRANRRFAIAGVSRVFMRPSFPASNAPAHAVSKAESSRRQTLGALHCDDKLCAWQPPVPSVSSVSVRLGGLLGQFFPQSLAFPHPSQADGSWR